MSPTPTQDTSRPWPFGTSRPSPTPCTDSLLAGPMVSGIGLRNLWSGRRHVSPFPPSSGPSPPYSPCSPRSSDLPKDPCPTPASSESPCWGTGEQAPVDVPVALPPPNFCPFAALLSETDSCCCWGSLGTAEEPLLLLRQRWGWGLGRNWAVLPLLWVQRGRMGLWCSAWGAPGLDLPWD